MPLHPDILLDFGPMMAESVGQNGITLQELEEIVPQSQKISQGLFDLRRLGQLPFQDLPYHDELVIRISEKAKKVKEKFEAILLIGIGGSSLGAQFLNSSLGSFSKSNLHICDHIDPVLWKHLDESLDYQKTLLLVISKSGRTIETLAAFLYFQEQFRKKLGVGFKKNIFIITDPENGPLRRLAREEKIDSFEIPQPVGGRYSLLTAAGLFPAAFVGVDLSELMAGARRMDERCKKNDPWLNPALMSAVLHYLAGTVKNRKLRVVMPYGERLRDYAPWFAQLWAESLGKKQSLQGRDVFAGTTPITARGPEDQHSQAQLYLEGPQDKTITFIAAEKERHDLVIPRSSFPIPEAAIIEGKTVHQLLQAERMAVEQSLLQAGRPNQTIMLPEVNAYSLGQLIYMAELETVYAGALYDVNPFDQPAVEGIKNNLTRFLTTEMVEKRNRRPPAAQYQI